MVNVIEAARHTSRLPALCEYPQPQNSSKFAPSGLTAVAGASINHSPRSPLSAALPWAIESGQETLPPNHMSAVPTIQEMDVQDFDRVVLLGSTDDIRGSSREFLRFGITLVVREDVLAALAEMAREPESLLIVSTTVSSAPLGEILELVVTMYGPNVMLGRGHGDIGAEMATAMAADVSSSLDLPLTAESLKKQILTIPRRGRFDRSSLTIGGLTVNPIRRHALWWGEYIDLTPLEITILYKLMQAYPYTAPIEELSAGMSGSTSDPVGTIRVSISRTRSRLRSVGRGSPAVIETIRGIGYRLSRCE